MQPKSHSGSSRPDQLLAERQQEVRYFELSRGREARRSRQYRWLWSHGIPARPTDGDPSRPSTRPAALRERRRLSYLRFKARALGLPLAVVAQMTPRQPRPHLRGRNARLPRRDRLGRFLLADGTHAQPNAVQTLARPRGRAGAHDRRGALRRRLRVAWSAQENDIAAESRRFEYGR